MKLISGGIIIDKMRGCVGKVLVVYGKRYKIMKLAEIDFWGFYGLDMDEIEKENPNPMPLIFIPQMIILDQLEKND